ncbi:unnamed protein product [[Candida] boidinii]|nr:unnamed protein product [[Candida] boidinii]
MLGILSTFIQPRPLLRAANSFSISVSELKKGKNLLEPSLSSLKIHRGSSSLKVNRKTSTIVDVPSTIPQLPTTDSSLDKSTVDTTPTNPRKTNDSSAIDDTVPTTIPPPPHSRSTLDDSVKSYDMKDLKNSNKDNNDNKYTVGSDGMIHLVDADSHYSHGYEFDKVTPFGGFSKPDYKQLLDTQNIFASAPWRIVEFDKGNGSLKKAVRLARLSNEFDDDVKWIVFVNKSYGLLSIIKYLIIQNQTLLKIILGMIIKKSINSLLILSFHNTKLVIQFGSMIIIYYWFQI